MNRKTKGTKPPRRMRGFERAAGLMQHRIRAVGEERGFAVSRLLTHWEAIVGPQFAKLARPVKISYAQGGMGATLTVLTTGAQAPLLQAQMPKILEKANACYGYAAISRIRITQTAPSGFSEGQVSFEPAGKSAQTAPEVRPNPHVQAKVAHTVHAISDEGLRDALASLGEKILSRNAW